MPAITKLPFKFHTSEILISLGDLLADDKFNEQRQLSITHSSVDSGMFSSIGSLYSYEDQEFNRHTRDFTILNERFKSTYLEEVISGLKEIGKEDDVQIGRVRILMLPPASCYSYHRDPEDFRYHIPLMTHTESLFISAGVVERMEEEGTVYRFKTRDFHTAINGSRVRPRIHLVFDTYQENGEMT